MTNSASRGTVAALRVYLTGAVLKDFEPQVGSLPWGHTPVNKVCDAEAVFVWLRWGGAPTSVIFDIGAAHALGIPIFIGAMQRDLLDYLPFEVVKAAGGVRISVRDVPLKAYEDVMADADLTARKVFTAVTSPVRGTCKACHSSYSPGDRVMVRQQYGALHVDCYERQRAPGAAHIALFNAELVAAVREENARLEGLLRT